MIRSKLPWLVLGLLSVLWVPRSVAAGDAVEIAGVRVGIAGHYKAGLWTPVEVTLRSAESTTGRLTVTVADGDGVPCQYAANHGRTCTVAPGGETNAVALVRFGRAAGGLTVEFVPEQGPAVQRTLEAGETAPDVLFPKAVPSHEMLMVLVGADSVGAEELSAAVSAKSGERITTARVERFRQLPEEWLAWESADLLVLSTSKPAVYDGASSSGSRLDAMEQWVRMGGTMLLSLGRNAEPLASGGGPLVRFLPGKFQRSITLRQGGAVEAYLGSPSPLPSASSGGPFQLPAVQLSDVQGVVEANEGAMPLVLRRSCGFGQVVFSAVDLGAPPFDHWQDRGAFLAKLLELPIVGGETATEGSALTHFGYDDLAGQLRSSLDQYAGLPLIDFWTVAPIVLIYLALIGPVDYFLHRRFTRRMILTWFTFPVTIAAVCIGTYVAAFHFKGDRIRANQVDLVDLDLRSRSLRGTSWAGMLSPKVEHYRAAYVPSRVLLSESGGEAPAVWTSWLGLPGEALGGMDPKTSGPMLRRQPYRASDALDALEDLPIPMWSTRTLTARWRARADRFPEAAFQYRDRILTGSVTNTLDFPLVDGWLCHDRWVYPLGTIAPGESVQLESSSERRDLKGLLSGRRDLFAVGAGQPTPYDLASVEPEYILRAMMFYRAAGGYAAARIAHRYQSFIDLSGALKTGDAVLVARAPSEADSPHHGARLLCNGESPVGPEDRRLTIFRFVIPVQQGEGE